MSIVDLGEKRTQLRKELKAALCKTMLPKPDLHVDQWADGYRVLPSESSAITGQWQTSAFEVARSFMRSFTEPGVRISTAMASAQIMKTSAIENLIGYRAHQDPGPTLIYEPTGNTAKRFDEDKLEPMFRASPALANLFGGKKALQQKHPDFLSCHKKYAGGFTRVMTSDSPANLAQTSARDVMYDELDKMKITKDGDATSLGDERLKNFSFNSLSVRVSTPTVTGKSAIAKSYDESDQRKPYVCCPHCSEWHYMIWDNVIFDKDDNGNPDPDTARYVCGGCGVVWTEAERVRLLTTDGGVYAYQTKKFECCGETQDPAEERLWEISEEYRAGYALCKHCGERAVSNRHAGFWAWEAYHPGRPLSDLIRAFLDCKGDRNKLRNFYNSKRAETFSEEIIVASKNVDPDHIMARAEPPWPAVPSGVIYAVAGVDVQSGEKGRLECEIVGVGKANETWSLGYHIIEGDPSEDHVWGALDQILLQPLASEIPGKMHYIQAACIDTGGHNADQVVRFCGERNGRRVWAIKGANERPGSRKVIWPRQTSASKHGGTIYTIGTQSAKDLIGKAVQVTAAGPSFMHIPRNRHSSWYKQLTAEHQVRVSLDSGGEGIMWLPKPGHKRNEALDCRVYAIAAIEGLRALGVAPQDGAGSGVAPLQPPVDGQDQQGDGVPVTSLPKCKPQPKRRRPRQASSFWG